MTVTHTQTFCDICGKDISGQNTASKDTKYTIPVIFHTNQTDGRPVSPHVTFERLDLCGECLMKISRLHAEGCQGNNRYYWDNKK